jgi:hypothetical protein
LLIVSRFVYTLKVHLLCHSRHAIAKAVFFCSGYTYCLETEIYYFKQVLETDGRIRLHGQRGSSSQVKELAHVVVTLLANEDARAAARPNVRHQVADDPEVSARIFIAYQNVAGALTSWESVEPHVFTVVSVLTVSIMCGECFVLQCS